MIEKIFRSRTEWRLKNKEKRTLNSIADCEEKPMKLLCHKRDVRETVKTSNESSGSIEDSLDSTTINNYNYYS